MSLKLRLNLVISVLLALVFMGGVVLNIVNARQNVRAEVESTEKLALYLFDAGALHTPLHLQRLQHMRHVRIELYDKAHRLIDSNRQQSGVDYVSESPDWFKALLDAFSPPWHPIKREIRVQDEQQGELVITPDPTYEYSEIWKQIIDLLVLLALFFVATNLLIAWALNRALEPTMHILQTLNQVESGDMQARLPEFKLPELAKIGDKFNHMVETLQQSMHRNHQLSQQLINLQEHERKNLARDLHDEFGQSLTAIHADATVVSKLAQSKYPELLASANAISQLSKHLMEMVSGLLQRLRPATLDELGLAIALQELISTWKTRNDKITCTLHMEEALFSHLNEASRMTIYRLVQECLTNITRHAQASDVSIALTPIQSGLEIAVSDNGKGFDIKDTNGFGLLGMRERVEGLGGRLTIASSATGTNIKAWLPV